MASTRERIGWNDGAAPLGGLSAVVTGAGRGIGRGCALELAGCGATVVLVSRTGAELELALRDLEAAGGSGRCVVCDVTNADEVEHLFRSVEGIDIVVNAAGTNIPESFIDVTPQNLERVLAVNVKGSFLIAQAAARRMVDEGRSGTVINISSQMGHVGAAGRTVYCASKHAVEGLTKAMAVELAPNRIRVNAVAPTFIETPLTAPFFAEPRFREWVLDRIPLREIGEVQDVAAAVSFLASPAARLITGASLVVDGGWTAQ